jgi:hypothetical protein
MRSSASMACAQLAKGKSAFCRSGLPLAGA